VDASTDGGSSARALDVAEIEARLAAEVELGKDASEVDPGEVLSTAFESDSAELSHAVAAVDELMRGLRSEMHELDVLCKVMNHRHSQRQRAREAVGGSLPPTPPSAPRWDAAPPPSVAPTVPPSTIVSDAHSVESKSDHHFHDDTDVGGPSRLHRLFDSMDEGLPSRPDDTSESLPQPQPLVPPTLPSELPRVAHVDDRATASSPIRVMVSPASKKLAPSWTRIAPDQPKPVPKKTPSPTPKKTSTPSPGHSHPYVAASSPPNAGETVQSKISRLLSPARVARGKIETFIHADHETLARFLKEQSHGATQGTAATPPPAAPPPTTMALAASPSFRPSSLLSRVNAVGSSRSSVVGEEAPTSSSSREVSSSFVDVDDATGKATDSATHNRNHPLMQGLLFKADENGARWKRRTVILVRNHLAYFLSASQLHESLPEMKLGAYKPPIPVQGSVVLQSAPVPAEPAPDGSVPLVLERGERRFFFAVPDRVERNRWVEALRVMGARVQE
jgi:hypothetical protein